MRLNDAHKITNVCASTKKLFLFIFFQTHGIKYRIPQVAQKPHTRKTEKSNNVVSGTEIYTPRTKI